MSDDTSEPILHDTGSVIILIESGYRMARQGWHGRDAWIALHRPDFAGDVAPHMTLPYVFMHTIKGEQVPFLFSQTDILAKDWVIVGHGWHVAEH